MRRTKEEALVTRENLLTAALQVFSQNGYSATRLDDIARAAEVTRGAIYHHFGGKEELYKALVTEKSAGVNQLANEIVAEGGTPAEILRRLLVRLFEYLADNEEYRALLELAVSKVEVTEGIDHARHGRGPAAARVELRGIVKTGHPSGRVPVGSAGEARRLRASQLHEWSGTHLDPRCTGLFPS